MRIKELCKKQNIKVNIETNGLFIVTFKLLGIVSGVVSGVVNRRAKLLEYLSKHKRIRIKEYMVLSGVSFRTAQRDLSKFQKERIIKFVGAPKTGHYILLKKNEKD